MMRRMLAGLAYLSAQDAGSEARLVALGLPQNRVGPRVNLKAGVMADRDLGGGPVARARVLLAASTHAGEDAVMLDAFDAAKGAGVFDLLILAPRHPERGAEVARLLAARGVAFGQRSRGDAIVTGVPVYLADTLGEMDLWYGMAGVTVIGGSFADRGGHTPFEPAAHGSAILHGPRTANFAEPFAALDAAGGAVAVADGAALATALCAMDGAQQAAVAAAARAALPGGADVAGLLAAIRQHAGKAR
jgi:3-deoxy-D-manno-octulosonic-acid transferase